MSWQVGAAPANPRQLLPSNCLGAGRQAKGQLPRRTEPSPGLSLPRQGVSGMCYFEQRVPCQALAGWRRWQGTRHGPWVRGNSKGSERGRRRLGRAGPGGGGSGARPSALASVPSLTELRRASAGFPSSFGTHGSQETRASRCLVTTPPVA